MSMKTLSKILKPRSAQTFLNKTNVCSISSYEDDNALTQKFINTELEFGARNYEPLPVVLRVGKGVYVWDVEGVKYFDFLSAYSAVNQGHCHHRIYETLVKQARNLTLTSRAFYNDKLGEYEKFVCRMFGFDKVLPMNTGVEAGETAIKLARKWGYEGPKAIDKNKARVLFCDNNFWGRTLAAVSSSSDPQAFTSFGPYMPCFDSVPYNDLKAIEEYLEKHGKETCAFMMEPIQGEAGIIIPDDGYLKGVRKLCDEYNVLWIADEIQSGLGRAGHLLAVNHENVKPDIVLLGKALSGGFLPVSAVLSSESVMQYMKPGQHGSTYGGNPLACAVAITALDVIAKEKLCENSNIMGELLRKELRNKIMKTGRVREVRGRGLMNAIEVNPGVDAWKICMKMGGINPHPSRLVDKVLAKPTHNTVIRLAPPLTITVDQIHRCVEVITEAFFTYNH